MYTFHLVVHISYPPEDATPVVKREGLCVSTVFLYHPLPPPCTQHYSPLEHPGHGLPAVILLGERFVLAISVHLTIN